MKTVLVASVALALVALCAVPATVGAQPPGTDSVSGSASECVELIEPIPGQVICLRRPSLDVDVASGAGGENPTGTVSLASSGSTPGGTFSVAGEPSCLSVTGNVAIIGFAGTLHQGGLGQDAPIAGVIRVVDGGGPDSGADTVEVAYLTGDPLGPPLPGPTTCSTFPGSFPSQPLPFPDFTNDVGDIVVTDAPSTPTTKDQCKNGGWRNFGIFKNQGDCVSFVATNHKNPSSG